MSNFFHIGRLGFEKARIISIGSHLRKKYHDTIIRRVVRILSGPPTPEQIAQGIESSSALIPDNTVTTQILVDKTLAGSTLAPDALTNSTILLNPSLENSLPNSPNLVSNLTYAKREIANAIIQLDIPNAIANLGNIFEGKLDFVESSLPIIDASLQIIDTIFWATESRFANQSITQTQLSNSIILSSNATIPDHEEPSPERPINTKTVRSNIDAIVDGASFTIRNLAQAVSDLSYDYVVSTLPLLKTAAEYDLSANSVIDTQSIYDISLAIPLQYPFESTHETYTTSFDASLTEIQTQFNTIDASFSGIISNAITTFDTAIASIYSVDNSFGLLSATWDASYGRFIQPAQIDAYSLNSNIELSTLTTSQDTLLFDNSSNSPATTEYVKLVLAGSLANDPGLLDALVWIRNAIANDASFAYNTIRQIGELDTAVSQESLRIDQIETGNNLPVKSEQVADIIQQRNSADSSLSLVSLPVYDASIQLLESLNPFQSVNYSTVIDWLTRDLSLNLIARRADASLQSLAQTYSQSDANAASFSLSLTQAIPIVEEKIASLDSSVNNTVSVINVSQINYDVLKYTTDSSLQSITDLCDSMDASNAAVVAGIQTINNLGQQLDGSMVATYTYIKESSITRDGSLALIDNDPRYGALDMSLNVVFQYASNMNNTTRQNITSRMGYIQTADLSLNQCEISVKTRETNFDNLHIDSSAGEMMRKYMAGDQSYNNLDNNFRNYVDASVNNIDQKMATFNLPLLVQIGNTMEGLDNRPYGILRERCLEADSSLARYFTSTPTPLTILDESVNLQTGISTLHDASIVNIESNGFITGPSLSFGQFVLPENTRIQTTLSGETIAIDTQYYWNYLREKLQGNNDTSLSSIHSFAESIGNINIWDYIDAKFTTIATDLSIQTLQLDGISSVNLEEFNVDASLTLLDATYTAKENDVNQLDWFYGWKTATDASVSSLTRTYRIMESSLNFTLNFFNTTVPQKTRLYNNIDASYARFVENIPTQFENYVYTFIFYEGRISDFLLYYNIIKNTINFDLNAIDQRFTNAYKNAVRVINVYPSVEESADNRLEILNTDMENYDSSLNTISQEIEPYLETRIGTIENTTYHEKINAFDNSLNIYDISLSNIDIMFSPLYQLADNSLSLLLQTYQNIDSVIETQVSTTNAMNTDTATHATEIANIEDTGIWMVDGNRLDPSSIVLPVDVELDTVSTILATTPATTSYVKTEFSLLENANGALDTLIEFANALDNDASLNNTINDGLSYVNNNLQTFEEDFAIIAGELDSSMVSYSTGISGLSTQYSTINSSVESRIERIKALDSSINTLEGQYNGFSQSLNTLGNRLVKNDTSTNNVSDILTNREDTIWKIDGSLNLLDGSAGNVDSLLTTDLSLSYSIASSLTTNDTSTNNLGATTILPVREASANSVFTLLGTPSGVSGQSTNTTITVSYQPPLLGNAMNLSKYTIVGTPVSGTSTLLTRDVSSNVVSTTFTELTQNIVYNFAVTAYTDYSIASTMPYIYGTRLNAPSGFAITGTTATSIAFQVDSATLTFEYYNIYYKALTSGFTTNITSASNIISLTGLETGRIYDISMNIQNTYGPSSWTGGRNSTRLNFPYTLSVANITSNQATVNISPALVDQDCSYVLRTMPDVNQYVLPVGTTTQTLTGLAANTNYTIYLDASNLYTGESINTGFATIPLLNTVSLISVFDACYNVTRSSNKVSNWRDRTTNVYDASQTVSTKRPDYNSSFLGTGKPAIDFTGSGTSDGWLLVTNQPTVTTNDITLFIVFKRSSSATRTNANMSILSSIGTWQTGSIHLGYKTSSTNNRVQISVNSTTNDFLATETITKGSTYVMVVNITSIGGCVSSFRLNGTASTSTLTHSSSPINLRGFFEFGGWSVDAGRTMDGGIGEIIQYNRSLYITEMQMQEARLAWKWGLTSSLPSEHPYKTSQPTSLIPTYYYNFETFSGNSLANMATGTAVYDATIANANMSTSIKKYGSYSALSNLSGGSTKKLITMPQINFVNLSQFSIGIWVYLTSLSNNTSRWIFSYRNSSDTFIYACKLSVTNIGTKLLYVYSNGILNSVSISSSCQINTWYHIALVQSGSTLKIYENGTLITTTTLVVENSTSLVSTNSWLGGGGDSAIFDGYMDDYRFYSYALTDAEVLQLSL